MTDAKGRWDELPALPRRLVFRCGRQIHGALPEPRSEFLAYHQHQPNVVKEQDMTIIITDEDVKRLLPMRDCIESMRVAFGDLANGAAVNRPRVRYLARHPDPERKYLANVHVGAVPSYGIACVRAGSQVIRPPSAGNDRRLSENPQAFNWGVVILYSIETAEPLALMHEFRLSGMRVGATTAVAIDHPHRPARRSRLCPIGQDSQCPRLPRALQ